MNTNSAATEAVMMKPARGLSRLLALRDGVEVMQDEKGVRLVRETEVVRTAKAGTALRDVLQALAAGGVPLCSLTEMLPVDDQAGEASCDDGLRLAALMKRYPHLFTWSVAHDTRPLVTVDPISRRSRFAPAPLDDALSLRLSRFAFMRRDGAGLVMESPLSLFRVRLQAPESWGVASALGEVTSVSRLAGLANALDLEAVRLVVEYLVAAGMVDLGTPPDGGSTTRFAEDSDEVLRQWAFHDLLFHTRSRLGRHDQPIGATFPFTEDIEHEPPLKPTPVGPSIPLYRPDLNEILDRDPRFTTALESRCSIRGYDQHPMTAQQLGEFLYRVHRVRAVYGPDESTGVPYQAVSRPYPTGGAMGDLDIYVTVNRCTDLPRGVYYYDPAAHRLVAVNNEEGAMETLLGMAYTACGGAVVPDVLLTITARFQRMAWKYSSIAYASTLKHVGVLYQTMYLVATAMRLAPCALGSGDMQSSAEIFGLDWRRESSVGEFMLGSRPVQRGPRDGERQPIAGWRAVNDPQWAIQVAQPEQTSADHSADLRL